MVKITYIGKRNYRSLRTRGGHLFGWNQGETIDVEDEGLLAKLKASKNFIEPSKIGKEDGSGGLKTHVRPPKSLSRPDKPRKHLGKSKQAIKKEVKCPKGSYKCKGVCKCKGLKKPKGLRKPKRMKL